MSVTRPAIILLGHGARDAEWADTLKRLQKHVEQRAGDIPVASAFLGHLPPSLPECIERLIHANYDDLRVVPIFIARGGHLKQDIPAVIEEISARHPGIRITLLPAVGEVDSVLDAMAAWIAASVQNAKG